METPIKTSVTPTLSMLEQVLQEPKNHREQVVASPHLRSEQALRRRVQEEVRRTPSKPHSPKLSSRDLNPTGKRLKEAQQNRKQGGRAQEKLYHKTQKLDFKRKVLRLT